MKQALSPFLLVAGGFLWLGASGSEPPSRPVSLDLLREYVDTYGYRNVRLEPRGDGRPYLLVPVRTPDGASLSFALDLADYDGNRALRFLCLTMVSAPRGSPRLMRTLAELNWENVVGGYGWDPSDGEVRYRHTVFVNGGLSYEDFAATLHRIEGICFRDLPALRRALDGEGDGDTAGTAAGAARPKEHDR